MNRQRATVMPGPVAALADQLGTVRIGPSLAGQRMSLAEFARAEAEEGYHYELEQGVIVVDVPKLTHELVVANVRNRLVQHQLTHPDQIFLISGSAGSVLRLPGMESERHPDSTVYLRGPAPGDDDPWEHWTPELVVEVVSASSVRRDYETKRDEYLRGGVLEYVVFDPRRQAGLVLTRHGDVWDDQALDLTGTWTTQLLPGFALPLSDVFARLASQNP